MHKTAALWSKVTGFILLGHSVALLLLFFVYQDGMQHLSLVLSAATRAKEIEFSIAIETIAPRVPAKQSAPAAVVKKTVPKKILPAKKETPAKKVVKKAPAKQLPDHLDLSLAHNKNMQGFEAEFKLLYQEFADHWAPPPGIPAESQCLVTVYLDRQGGIKDLSVEKSSGMLVFDLAARNALSEIEFPKFVWGKSITITFTL